MITFDQQWALTLLELTVGTRLRAEFAAAGKPEDFEVAQKTCLMAERWFDRLDAGLRACLCNEGAPRGREFIGFP